MWVGHLSDLAPVLDGEAPQDRNGFRGVVAHSTRSTVSENVARIGVFDDPAQL